MSLTGLGHTPLAVDRAASDHGMLVLNGAFTMRDVNHADAWDAAYHQGSAPWDLGAAAPPLRRLAQSGRLAPGRMIVLGAGRGHDARAFARHGFAVTAVDFAAAAVQDMQRLADAAAPVTVVQHDLFTLPAAFDGRFDYVLEHTCLCAIDPQRRAAFAELVVRLLAEGGRYISLAFPLGPRGGGPPFAYTVEELVALLEPRGVRLVAREVPSDSVKARRGREALLEFRRTTTARATE